jgi:L-alanine-DL-glutamate epimerase-like enolase superfamily enzyme
VELTWTVEQLVLARPFRIARGTLTQRQAVTVELRHDGVTGHGEAVASPYRGQDRAALEASLRELRDRVSGLPDPFALLGALDPLTENEPERAGSLCAVDAAAHDWIGRRWGLPVGRLLGILEGERRTALSMGITDPESAAELARAAAGEGFEVLKVKVGLESAAAELDLVRAVREAAPSVTLLADANGGWEPSAAPTRIHALAGCGVALVEQPVGPGQAEALRVAWEAAPVPVYADEDAVTAADVPALAGCVTGVNVKLHECGGIRAAVRMIHTARACGLGVMLGCAVSSSLGIAPAAHLAPLADWLDLDGHLHLADDPWTGLAGPGGTLTPAGSGLGVAPRRPGSR